MYRDLLVLKYAELHKDEVEAMPIECWNELIKFADWLDKNTNTSGQQTCFNCGGPVYKTNGYLICTNGCGGPVSFVIVNPDAIA